MKLTELLELIKKANPHWAISSEARPDSTRPTDGCIGQIDHGRIDVWRFGDDKEMEAMQKDVDALMVYICTACVHLPALAKAADELAQYARSATLEDCPVPQCAKDAEEILTQLNSINLCQKH